MTLIQTKCLWNIHCINNNLKTETGRPQHIATCGRKQKSRWSPGLWEKSWRISSLSDSISIYVMGVVLLFMAH